MQRISTPTAIPDMFGAGKNGFNDDPLEGPSTELDAAFHNNVQEEICRCLEDQGVVLSAVTLNQLATALNSWQYSGDPGIKNGGTFSINSGAILNIDSGGAVVLSNGSTFAVESNVTFIWADSTLTIGSSAANAFVVHGDTTFGTDASNLFRVLSPAQFDAAINFGANTITGAGGTITTSTVNASTVAPTVINFATTSQSSTGGRLVYNGRRLSIGDGTAARRVYHPKTAYAVSHSTVNANADITGASVSMDIGNNEWVYVRVHAVQACDAAGEDVKLLIAATNGVDNVSILNSGDDDQAQVFLPTVVAANDRSPNGFTVRWKPTNDIVAPNNTTWTIYARHGVSGGATLKSSNVKLEVWYE